MPTGSFIAILLRLVTFGGSQNFLGAPWVDRSLDLAPTKWKRSLALRYLASSPHYFYRTSANTGMSFHDFLEAEVLRNQISRRLIMEGLIAKYLKRDYVCLDFGCGPGFLAAAVAPLIAKVIACDISRGVLACAKVINFGSNIEYRAISQDGAIPAPDESVDLIYSIAVAQHLTDAQLSSALREFRRVLKPGGLVICQIILEQEGGESEAEWSADKSAKGRLKRHGYLLRCFSRSRQTMQKLVSDAQFESTQIRIGDLGVDIGNDNIAGSDLCILTR